MILTAILFLMLVIVTFVLIGLTAVSGAIGIIASADVIVACVVIGLIIRHFIKKRNKKG